MIFTDTHTHLYSSQFQDDRNEMMHRAVEVGVSRLFVPSIDSSYTQKMYDLESQFPENVYLMMGLHPTYVKENYLEELAHVETELAKRKFYAVGEIGMDLFWDKSFLKEQQHAFQHQIQLAKKYQLGINIHCRDAFDETFEVLESEKATDLFGIFHCFTGDLEQAQRASSAVKAGAVNSRTAAAAAARGTPQTPPCNRSCTAAGRAPARACRKCSMSACSCSSAVTCLPRSMPSSTSDRSTAMRLSFHDRCCPCPWRCRRWLFTSS